MVQVLPGFAELGVLVRATEVYQNSIMVEDRNGRTAEFCYNCGSASLNLLNGKKIFQTIRMKND